ncbi:unnamed protein product [Schistosoma turkestanicum]|nr:unnamed protein product [Schistosoma turkestanicum]
MDRAVDARNIAIRVIDHMLKIPSNQGYGSNEFKSIIDFFESSFFAIESPENIVSDYRLWIASNVLSNGEHPERLTRIFTDLGKYAFNTENKPYNEYYIELLLSFQLTLCNYLGTSELLAEKMSMQDAYLKEIYRIHQAILPYDVIYDDGKKITFVAEIIIKTLYNMLQHENTSICSALNKNNLINMITYYAKSKNTNLQTAAYLSFAYINNEETLLTPEETDSIKVLLNILTSTLKNPSTRVNGYSCEEILKGLRLLASSDKNREFICHSTLLQSIHCTIKTLEGKALEEVILLLLKLTFNPEMRNKIRREFGSIFKDLEIVYRKKESKVSNNNIQTVLYRILWQINEDHTSIDYESKLNHPIQLEHVMISYSHKQKEMTMKLVQHLKDKGYKVWFDLNNMKYTDNTFKCLAEAIEKSYVVCIIYSENYKHSEYAEMEATYALDLKKPIICLRAQRDYKPKGWLGFIIARQQHIDISGKYPFEEYFTALCGRIDEYLQKAKRNNS